MKTIAFILAFAFVSNAQAELSGKYNGSLTVSVSQGTGALSYFNSYEGAVSKPHKYIITKSRSLYLLRSTYANGTSGFRIFLRKRNKKYTARVISTTVINGINCSQDLSISITEKNSKSFTGTSSEYYDCNGDFLISEVKLKASR